MSGIFRDVRFALQQLRKNLGFTSVAMLTLAVGIGANTTMFSTVNAMLLRPFPYPDLHRVVTVWETIPNKNVARLNVAPANFLDWKEQSSDFQRLAAIRPWEANLSSGHFAEHVEGSQVSADFFALLGMSPQFGRYIGGADFQNGISPVVVLSHRFWQRQLGEDPAIVGKQLLINGQQFTVVGVASAELDFPLGSQIWTPLDLNGAAGNEREKRDLTVIGRLKDASSITQAEAGLITISNRIAQQYPGSNAGHSAAIRNMVDDLTADSRQVLTVLMGAAIFVLLLACGNVANLQLARAAARQKEVATRLALGASRWLVGRQLLIESVVVSVLGSGGALLLSWWSLRILQQTIPPFIVEHIAGLKHLQLDWRVFVFTLAAAIVTGLMAGLAPTLYFSRSDINDRLKEGARGGSGGTGRSRFRALLVVSEVALSLVLLVGAGLMVKGFRTLMSHDMGFERHQVLTFHVALPEAQYRDRDRVRGYHEQVLRNLKGLSGVESAACATSLPSGWSWNWIPYSAEGQAVSSAAEKRSVISQVVSPDFFSVLRIPLREGRLISDEDSANSPPIAVISQTMARQNWPDQNPIGQHIQIEPQGPWRRVVGVVADIQPVPLNYDPAPTVYIPMAQAPESAVAFVVRTVGDPTSLTPSVVAQSNRVDRQQPPYDIRTLDQILSDSLSGIEQSARLMLIFGVCALVLASAGIYAVIAYSVAQRTHEMGMRIALGARYVQVLRLVVFSAMKIAVIGLAIGVLLAVLLTRAVSSALFGVVQADVITVALLTMLLAAVAALAAYIPARRAARVDPMVALRYE